MNPQNDTSHDTGWRRVIGCLKLQVSFRKRATSYRALLRKMTCKDTVSYDSTPPCTIRIIKQLKHRPSACDVHSRFVFPKKIKMRRNVMGASEKEKKNANEWLRNLRMNESKCG